MGRKKISGLFKRHNVWHIDKVIHGVRIRESTRTSDLTEAEHYLARCTESIRQAQVYGVRPKRTFEEAAARYLLEKQHKKRLRDDITQLKGLLPYVGNLPLESIHMGGLQPYIAARRKAGVSSRTINHGLAVVRHLLNLAAGSWMDENGLTWLQNAPKIKLLPEPDLRKPHPLDWQEQELLFESLPGYLSDMASFVVNTGCRDGEICSLKWKWEFPLPELPGRSVFIIPGEHVKNGDDRLVVLNDEAQKIVEKVRGKHDEFVFTYRGRPLYSMRTSSFRSARKQLDLDVRIHDLRHTFGRRLRSAGVSYEDRQDLLGHRSSRITTHYSVAEVENLILAANRICGKHRSGMSLTVLRLNRGERAPQNPHNVIRKAD